MSTDLLSSTLATISPPRPHCFTTYILEDARRDSLRVSLNQPPFNCRRRSRMVGRPRRIPAGAGRWVSIRLMVTELDFGVEGNQGKVKFFQRLIFFGDHQEVFPNLGDEAGGSDLGAHKGVALAHGVKVGELPARRAMCIFPIHFSGTESNTVNHDSLCPTHDRSIVFDAR